LTYRWKIRGKITEVRGILMLIESNGIIMNTATSLFDSIPKTDYFHLFPDGNPDFKKVIKLLEYQKKDVSVATGIPEQSIRFEKKMPSTLKERLIEWAIAINLVGIYFQDEHKTILWFRVSNPLLGNISPRDMIRIGRFNKLLKFIQTALDENSREFPDR